MQYPNPCFIAFPSHRQREKALPHLSNKQAFFSMSRRGNNYGVYQATDAEIVSIKEKGIRFSRWRPPYERMGGKIG